MSVLLHVDSSPMGEGSISRRLTREFVEQWRAANPHGRVIPRDLAAIEIPPVDAAWVAANYAQESRTPEQNAHLALSTELARELLEADEYVIGAPIHNWGPSTRLKLWADQIVRFGQTVLISPTGMHGALGGKRATFVIAAGRRYGPGSENAGRNHLEPWLRTFFGNLGIADMRFLFADGTVAPKTGKTDLETFLAPHVAAVRSLAADSAMASRG